MAWAKGDRQIVAVMMMMVIYNIVYVKLDRSQAAGIYYIYAKRAVD